MPRWRPNSAERLQKAAMELFLERGYDVVTVAEIAARAGLTKRSFFNHFADKREVLFAGAADLEVQVLRCIQEADPKLSPFEAGIDALGRAGQSLSAVAPYISLRGGLIASSEDLRERAVMKSDSLSAAVAAALEERGVTGRIASFAAHAAVEAFAVAYDDWGRTPEADFADLIAAAAADVQIAVRASRPDAASLGGATPSLGIPPH